MTNPQITEMKLTNALANGPMNEIELARAANYCVFDTGQSRKQLRKVLKRIAEPCEELKPHLWVWRARG